jgi:hypothetical protein
MLSYEVPDATASEVKLLDGRTFPTVTRLLALPARPNDELWITTRDMVLDSIELQFSRGQNARSLGA